MGGVKSLCVRQAKEWCVGFYLSLCHGESFAKAYKAGMLNVKMQVGEAPPEMVLKERKEGDSGRVLFPVPGSSGI